MTHQEASSVVKLPLARVYERLARVEDWPQFLMGVEAVRRTGHDRFVFTVKDGANRVRDVDIAVGRRPGEHRIAWHALGGPKFDGELRLAEAGSQHTRVQLMLTAEPAGFLAGLSEMVGASAPAAVIDLQRLEAHLGAAPVTGSGPA
ncbi:MAG: SRPBCC family protein [Kineosporiaceae bacterium]|jgi:uncharacterized membrane protein